MSMQIEQEFERRLLQKDITSRSFLSYCGVIADALGMGSAAIFSSLTR